MLKPDVPPQVNRLFLFGQKALIKKLIVTLQDNEAKIDRQLAMVEEEIAALKKG